MAKNMSKKKTPFEPPSPRKPGVKRAKMANKRKGVKPRRDRK